MPDYTEVAYYDPVLDDLYLEPDPGPAPPDDPRPEHVDYRDEGCDLAPECLACPLPRCRHDDPGWLRREAKEKRNRDLLAVRREEGLGVVALANRFGLSRSMVPPHPQGRPCQIPTEGPFMLRLSKHVLSLVEGYRAGGGPRTANTSPWSSPSLPRPSVIPLPRHGNPSPG